MGGDEGQPQNGTADNSKNIDEWAQKKMESSGKRWSEKTTSERITTVCFVCSKLTLVVLLLYMFIISLGLMGGAFKVLGGKTSGQTFRQSELFNNPVAGISLGILATVLVQSSSTSTSVIITMAAAELVTMKNAIPMIMGANIGTSVTASIVSVAQIGDKDQYRRAFGGAIVHYCFNVLTVSILLPVEVITGMIEAISSAIVDAAGIQNDGEKLAKQDFLKIITKPVTKRLLQVDKKLVKDIANEKDEAKLAALEAKSIIVQSQSKDNHLFMDTPMSDPAAGVLLVIVSLLFLSICLMLLVKTLQSVFRGRAAIWMGKFLNLEFKRVPLLADYVLMVFGMGLTILMQSSSVTTSVLTPLVGIGLIRVDKMFPFTIGANIGTTVTGILAALASSNMVIGMQVAMSHLLFNVFGTLIWFAVPKMREAPLSMAKFLGNLASDLKWFPVFLIVFAWVLAPGLLLGLSIAGVAVVAVIGGIILLGCISLFTLIFLRAYPSLRSKLPGMLQKDPSWLPPSLRAQGDDGTLPAGSAQQAKGEQTGDADMGAANAWWQSAVAWGCGWFALMMLLVALPNCQWANLKYPKFDGRDHVGIGAWQACSAAYESSQDWARPLSGCSSSYLETCAAIPSCLDVDRDVSNEDYEKSWVNCRSKCSLDAWASHCHGMKCGGSYHAEQCTNVTQAVHQNFRVEYQISNKPAWNAGERCRDISDICDNGEDLGNAGVLGWLGFGFLSLGQCLLMAYVAMHKKRDMLMCLAASLASFLLAWILLLCSWAMFANAVRSDVRCVIVDASHTGAVTATGAFGDIVRGQGSYSFAFVVASWALATTVVGVVSHRLGGELLKRRSAKQGTSL